MNKQKLLRKEKVYLNGQYKYAYIYKNENGGETTMIKGKA